MRKKIFLWLSFLAVFTLIMHSCRNDQFPEQLETYSNSNGFQITSKRISLNQSKHRERLLPELEKAEAEFKAKTKSNAFGKVVSYGNGVSINTDNVIYIENGPDYYTYTFKIERDNAPANAPVENLVLTPLSDGSYRELLVTYTLTPQEKQLLENGSFVDLTGKTASQELVQGTYGTNLMGKTTTTQCHWETYTYDVPCPCEGHTVGQECTCPKGKPMQYVLTWNVCEEVEDTAPTGGTTDTGSSGGGGTGTATSPCEDPVSTQPQEPGSTLGTQDGCNTGIPTLPNLSNPKTDPCLKIKNLVAKPQVKDSLDTFKTHAQTNNKIEKGFQELKSGTLVKGNVTQSNQIEFGIGPNSKGTVHTHQPGTIGIFAPQDIMTFLHIVRKQDASAVGNAYSGTVSSSGTYFINFTGTASDLPPEMTKEQEEVYVAELVTNYIDFNDLILDEEGKSRKDKLSNQGLEKLFNYLINSIGLSGKITLIKEENGNTSTIEFNPDGTPKIPNPC